jgi:hypothetical protein
MISLPKTTHEGSASSVRCYTEGGGAAKRAWLEELENGPAAEGVLPVGILD